MSSSRELYNRLIAKMSQLVAPAHIHHLTNWAWMVVGIVQSNSVALSQIATHLPGEIKAESRVTTIRRWLKNLKVDVWGLYQPILAQVVAGWHASEAVVILDGVLVFGNRWQIFRLSLAHGQRAIPLVWKVVAGKGLTQREVLEPMLRQAAEFLRPRVATVRCLADAGFRDCDWADLCGKLGWHYDIRIACNTFITEADGRSAALSARVAVGQRRYFQNAWLTQALKLQTNVSVTWTDTAPVEMVAVISDQPAGPQRLREYALRMAVEQSFRDDQSGGFDLEHTRLQHADRLERLLLAVAIATLWCHELGEHVLSIGETARMEIDPSHRRELSLFQLGLRWLKRCVSLQLHRLPVFRAQLSPIKLAPIVKPCPS